jgi:DNA polymerase-3 subunit gamma/tau
VSGGRRPKRQLKPIFSAQPEAQPAADKPVAAKAADKPAAPKAAEPKPYKPQGIVEQLSQSSTSERRVPLLKRESLSISIKSGMAQAAREIQVSHSAPTAAAATATTPAAAPVSAKPVVDDLMFNEKDLGYYWQLYAGQLPKDYVAFARRMQMIRPSLMKDGHTFEVLVDNELSAKDFNTMAPHIIAFLRKSLQNRLVTMVVRVSAPSETIRVVGRVEKFQLMAKKNPSLMRLKDVLGLELY